jgi:hypothetical protein
MAKYIIEAPHTKADCLEALDEVLEEGTELLNKFHWGCKAGVHEGWALVEAESEAAAQAQVPASQRGKWRVTEVTQITQEQIKAAHQQ